VRSYELIEWGRRRIVIQKGEPVFIETAQRSRQKEIQMNGNIKKLSVLVGVPVMALFIMVGMASAHLPFHYYIKGVYKVTGFSSCDPASPGIMEAEYTFRYNGTGSIKGEGRTISASGPSYSTATAEFTYTVTEGGRIEFQYPSPPFGPGGLKVDFGGDGTIDVTMDGGPSHGVISPDGNTITISCGPPVFLNVIDPHDGTILAGPVWCVTTLSGMRIR
jgi:hypothetical protein